jgi:hypothetical protein
LCVKSTAALAIFWQLYNNNDVFSMFSSASRATDTEPDMIPFCQDRE